MPSTDQSGPQALAILNFRDIGGMRTGDGRRVRRGMVFRSGAPDYRGVADFNAFARLGIRHVCDFRSAGERPCDPEAWARSAGIAFFAPNAGKPVGDPVTALRRCTISTETTRELMHEVYAQIPVDQAPSFAALFDRLAAGAAPILIHCASGKDRTGVFTALLLDLLGVPRAAIAADYVLSNQSVEGITRAFRDDPRHAPLIAAPFEVWAPLMGCEVEYLDTLFDSLARTHGSAGAYLEQALGVGPRQREALRELLLTDA